MTAPARHAGSVGAGGRVDADERPHYRDVSLRPSAVARVWVGVGQPHETVAVPGVALGPHDVLVAVELSTICSCALRAVHGEASVPIAPAVLGHEAVGRVIAIGDEGASAADSSPVRVGDRVVWAAASSCGECDRCLRGLAQRCRRSFVYGRARIVPRWELSGAFASHVHLRAGTAIVRVPEALSAAALAPLACATATAWAALASALRTQAIEGARVRVHGAGLMGLTVAAMAADGGAHVTVIDPSASRRSRAAAFGAEPAAPDDVAPGAADIVVDTSGHALSSAIEGADAGGAVVLARGVRPVAEAMVSPERIASEHITVTGIGGYGASDLSGAVRFLTGPGRAYPFADAIGEVMSLSHLDDALAAASAPEAPLRVAVTSR